MAEEINKKMEVIKFAAVIFVPLLVLIGILEGVNLSLPKSTEVRNSYEQTMDTVVHIRAYLDEQYYMTEDYLYEDFAGAWQGSGALVSADGIVITAGHVIGNASRWEVTLRDGRVFETSVGWAADNQDVGFLKIDVNDISALKFADSPMKLGDEVFIYGHPLGWMNNWSVTKGIVSNLARDCEGFFGVFNMLQADAASWPGNSGGPVVNASGEVVGVLVGGIRGQECLSYISPSWIAKEWFEVFESWLDTRG